MGLGSNTGESLKILENAQTELRLILDSLRVSSVYRTKPRYVEDQPDFYNMAISGYTSLSPQALLEKTQSIEALFGRNRHIEQHNGPRTLDIDIVLYGDAVFQDSTLVIPHPRLEERAFVLVPLLELDSELVHPLTHVRFSEYLKNLPDQGIYPL